MLSSQRYRTGGGDREGYGGMKSSYQQKSRGQGGQSRGRESDKREFRSVQEGLFKGVRAAFLTGGRESEDLMEEFREHGGRVLNLDRCNY